ncbi:MAG: hypothetical protein NT013_15320 [Planctomycetia bacterium]|nr:hypothetical protein [Planctomycetia bacterium]
MLRLTQIKILSWFVASLQATAWAPIVVFCFHLFAMLVLDIYARVPDFDIPMHFVGGVAIAYFFGGCYRTALAFEFLGQPGKAVYAVVVLGMTALAAVVWEFAEFIADQTLGTYTQPGLPDTLLDLLMGLLGGIVFLVLHYRRWPPIDSPSK